MERRPIDHGICKQIVSVTAPSRGKFENSPRLQRDSVSDRTAITLAISGSAGDQSAGNREPRKDVTTPAPLHGRNTSSQLKVGMIEIVWIIMNFSLVPRSRSRKVGPTPQPEQLVNLELPRFTVAFSPTGARQTAQTVAQPSGSSERFIVNSGWSHEYDSQVHRTPFIERNLR